MVVQVGCVFERVQARQGNSILGWFRFIVPREKRALTLFEYFLNIICQSLSRDVIGYEVLMSLVSSHPSFFKDNENGRLLNRYLEG